MAGERSSPVPALPPCYWSSAAKVGLGCCALAALLLQVMIAHDSTVAGGSSRMQLVSVQAGAVHTALGTVCCLCSLPACQYSALRVEPILLFSVSLKLLQSAAPAWG